MKLIFVGRHYVDDSLNIWPSESPIEIPDTKAKQLLIDFPKDFLLAVAKEPRKDSVIELTVKRTGRKRGK